METIFETILFRKFSKFFKIFFWDNFFWTIQIVIFDYAECEIRSFSSRVGGCEAPVSQSRSFPAITIPDEMPLQPQQSDLRETAQKDGGNRLRKLSIDPLNSPVQWPSRHWSAANAATVVEEGPLFCTVHHTWHCPTALARHRHFSGPETRWKPTMPPQKPAETTPCFSSRGGGGHKRRRRRRHLARLPSLGLRITLGRLLLLLHRPLNLNKHHNTPTWARALNQAIKCNDPIHREQIDYLLVKSRNKRLGPINQSTNR